MPYVRDVLAALENIAPRRFAFSFDKVGLQVGSPDQQVTKAVVSLDRSLGAVKFGIDSCAQLLVAHHPLIFNPMESVDSRTHQGRTVMKLIQADMSFIAAHTNWDSARGGINDTLAELFSLRNVSDFGSASEVREFKLVVYCPEESVQRIIDEASEAGAGVIGAYSRCAFRSEGMGTFKGDEATKPWIGTQGSIVSTPEVRVEMSVREDLARAVERAVRKAHPYEEPSVDLLSMKPRREQPSGRIGQLSEPVRLADFAQSADRNLGVRSWTWGDPSKLIKKVAVVGGAADSEWIDAQRAGADLLVTGEVKQHTAVEATESGMCLMAAGHYQTEQPGCKSLRDRLNHVLPDIEWLLFSPSNGLNGRPF